MNISAIAANTVYLPTQLFAPSVPSTAPIAVPTAKAPDPAPREAQPARQRPESRERAAAAATPQSSPPVSASSKHAESPSLDVYA
jgi:hypothetical protein